MIRTIVLGLLITSSFSNSYAQTSATPEKVGLKVEITNVQTDNDETFPIALNWGFRYNHVSHYRTFGVETITEHDCTAGSATEPGCNPMWIGLNNKTNQWFVKADDGLKNASLIKLFVKTDGYGKPTLSNLSNNSCIQTMNTKKIGEKCSISITDEEVTYTFTFTKVEVPDSIDTVKN